MHANFVMLSHVFIIISHHFYAFFWPNLLTRCPVPVPVFAVFVFQKFTSGNILGIGRKFTKIFLCEIRQLKTKGQPRRRTTGHRRPPAVAQCGPAGGTHPCLWSTSSAPSDAYKIPKNLKMSGRPLFSRNSTPTRRHIEP